MDSWRGVGFVEDMSVHALCDTTARSKELSDGDTMETSSLISVVMMRPRWPFMIMLHENLVKLLLLYSRNGS